MTFELTDFYVGPGGGRHGMRDPHYEAWLEDFCADGRDLSDAEYMIIIAMKRVFAFGLLDNRSPPPMLVAANHAPVTDHETLGPADRGNPGAADR